jgi:uncharacterized protein
MQWKILQDHAPKQYAIVFETGDEVVATLTRFVREQGLDASSFTGIGAFSDVVLGFFELSRRDYRRIPIAEQVEVVSLIGDVALGPDGKAQLHPHVVVAKADGTAHGGHLLEAHVRPTLEVMLTEAPSYLQRRCDAETGLALIRM